MASAPPAPPEETADRAENKSPRQAFGRRRFHAARGKYHAGDHRIEPSLHRPGETARRAPRRLYAGGGSRLRFGRPVADQQAAGQGGAGASLLATAPLCFCGCAFARLPDAPDATAPYDRLPSVAPSNLPPARTGRAGPSHIVLFRPVARRDEVARRPDQTHDGCPERHLSCPRTTLEPSFRRRLAA